MTDARAESGSPAEPGAVVAEITMSLDGFVTGPYDEVGRGLGEGGERLHYWVFGGAWTYEDDRAGTLGSATGVDQQVLDEAFGRAGAIVVGRRMYDLAEGWGEEPAFDMPCFVVTHRGQEDRVAGTSTYTFVTDGVESAIRQARAAAGDKHVLLGGGASIIDQALAAGLVDEIDLHVAPVLLGAGRRLFADVGGRPIVLEPVGARESPYATHLRYRVVR